VTDAFGRALRPKAFFYLLGNCKRCHYEIVEQVELEDCAHPHC
jgi:hypothetical protein